MTLLGIHELSKSYGSKTLFKSLSFTFQEGLKIGLIGPNGSGKSTLLKILMGLDTQDFGSITRRQHLRLAYSEQDPSFPSQPIESYLVQHARGDDEVAKETKARILLTKAEFEDLTADASLLSGGWKKRLSIIAAFIQEPDLLLLDEPTNHLDLEGIIWLEKFLAREASTCVIVSHDRYFLENVCTKIVEMNSCYPEGLFMCDGSFSDFLEQKDAFLEAQANQERALRATVREELEWLRRSPKARTTKSVSRIKKAYALQDELSTLTHRNKSVQVGIDFSASERETRKLLVVKNLAKSFGEKVLFTGLDLQLTPGSRLGIMGKNGTGKSTLLKVLAGLVPQDVGTRKCAKDLQIVYFDQHREALPSHLTLKEALCSSGDTVNYRGRPVHVNGWAKKFLFSPDRLSMPISRLSGGERARILIARLMLEPADVLFLDEPTNDLDIPTLEVMEESLNDFPGAIVLISHDRCLVDRVCTQIVGLGTDLLPQIYADCQQWEMACSLKVRPDATVKPVKEETLRAKANKLSYKEQKELEGMEEKIVAQEGLICSLEEHSPDSKESLEHYKSLASAQKMLDELLRRWQELLDKAKAQA